MVRLVRKMSQMSTAMGLINYWSEVVHGWILLHGTMHLTLGRAEHKGESQDSAWLHGEGRRDLHTGNLFPGIMILVYWLKVNSSMTIIMDHLWCVPFHDQHFQCALLSAISTFRVWAWFLVRTVEIRESLSNVLTCLNLKSSFNHYWFSLSHCLITLQIELVHDLSLGLIPYMIRSLLDISHILLFNCV